jgi:hypothetical protein
MTPRKASFQFGLRSLFGLTAVVAATTSAVAWLTWLADAIEAPRSLVIGIGCMCASGVVPAYIWLSLAVRWINEARDK